MSGLDFEPWEPEETIGKLWHALASRLDRPAAHEAARVHLRDMAGRLAVLFRGLGGAPATELRAVADETSRHRLSFKRRLGTVVEAVPRTSFDGEALRLPVSLALFPARAANAAAYLWLAACAALAPAPPRTPEDPLQADLTRLASAEAMVAATVVAA
ncbi:MAG TPA: nitric oxide reductase D protein, partial [Aestuariivirga sp.]|nr:nitric oxide reductase D protein [Aestuariivirga sp.]